MLKVEINLYNFSELSPEAQRKAIEEHRRFLLDTLQPDFIDGVTDWNDPEKMEMYWAEYGDISDNDETVVESIEANEYKFLADGELCWTCHYVAGPKKGLTEIKIHGELVTVQEVTAE